MPKINKIYYSQSGPLTEFKSLQAKLIYDSYGIPIVDYGTINGIYIGKQRNPVTTAQKGIYWLEKYDKTKDVLYLNYFFNCSQ